MELMIGGKLKQLRLDKKLSIAELSRLSDVSTGLISQIERDLVVPSVTSLWRLAKALDTNINYFFYEEPHEEQLIIRKGSHRTIVTHHDSSFYKLLHTNRDDRALDMMVITLKAGYTYDKKPLCHEGEECGYVLKELPDGAISMARIMSCMRGTALISIAPCPINISITGMRTAFPSGQ